ncbi:MAG: pirin family protein [Myxococcota bacterium]|nr:pirin family protein [Myxococcota bacterium]
MITPPPTEPGFIGPGHLAVQVVRPDDLAASDPFVLLMDDRLELGAPRQIGGAHPHAGLETVTLILDGTLADRDEGELTHGDAIWMTAGRGIIHNEVVHAGGRARVLQLWIALPPHERETAPDFEVIRGATVPVRREPGSIARLYSGATGTLRSPTRNRAPVTLVDVTLDPGAHFVQELPASYNGFGYVVDGDVTIGGHPLARGQVGWSGPVAPGGASTLTLDAGAAGARLVLYAGEPQRAPLIQHGPFVAGSHPEIVELYRRLRAGTFEPMSAVARRHRREHALPPAR